MKTLFKLLLLTFSMLLSKETYSQDNIEFDNEGWKLISEDKKGVKYYVDIVDNLKSETDFWGVKKIWVKSINPKTTVKKKGKILVYQNTKSLLLYEIKCKTKEMRMTQFVTYNAKGDIIESSEEYYGEEFRTVVPNSIGESILTEGCF